MRRYPMATPAALGLATQLFTFGVPVTSARGATTMVVDVASYMAGCSLLCYLLELYDYELCASVACVLLATHFHMASRSVYNSHSGLACCFLCVNASRRCFACGSNGCRTGGGPQLTRRATRGGNEVMRKTLQNGAHRVCQQQEGFLDHNLDS